MKSVHSFLRKVSRTSSGSLTRPSQSFSRSFSATASSPKQQSVHRDHYPSNVGIVAMDVYFPKTFVRQTELGMTFLAIGLTKVTETFDGVGTGKYTIGLEQENMAFAGDREDIYSMSLTAVQSLMEKYKINYKDIGRLEVGTETVLDKSKSVKTVLLSLFEKSGNQNIEGIDTINACYGGTAALLNAVNWIESSSWDGRYALVVCGDIAVYSPGPARPTGGAGMMAMLIGKDAPIVLERGLRGTYMEHAYDFYKPNLDSEYPIVDGHLSISCYFRALDNCYSLFRKNFEKQNGRPFTVDDMDYAIFHSPYMKLVRKSFGRLYYLDYINDVKHNRFANVPANIKKLTAEQSYVDKELQKVFGDLSAADYTKKVEPSSLLPKNLGNSYTASMYTGLLSLISQMSDKDLLNKRVLMFSYGSGLAATLYSLGIKSSVAEIAKTADIKNRLAQRVAVPVPDYTKVMKVRESVHNVANYNPKDPVNTMFPGTFFLNQIDGEKRRFYDRVPSH